MDVNQKKLAALESEYKGYLKGDALDSFYTQFGIRFAAGHWCAGDFSDRFAPSGYRSQDRQFGSNIEAQIERVARAGIRGIEFHEALFIDEKYKRDPARISRAKHALREFKVTPTNMNTNLFSDPRWQLGGVTNPDAGVRRAALEVALQGVDIAKEMGCSSVSLWPGTDGWDYNFEVNYGRLLERFIEACIAINKKAKANGLKFGLEAKLHEPREGNLVISTTPKAMFIANLVNAEVGGKNMGVCVDYGHEQMYGAEPADMVHTAKVFGVPMVNFHLNTAKLHSNDEDRVAGTGDNWRMVDFCYAAIDTGYDGWFGEDQYTYRMDPVKAMALSREIFGNLMKKALMIYSRRKELQRAQGTGDAAKTIDVVKEILI